MAPIRSERRPARGHNPESGVRSFSRQQQEHCDRAEGKQYDLFVRRVVISELLGMSPEIASSARGNNNNGQRKAIVDVIAAVDCFIGDCPENRRTNECLRKEAARLVVSRMHDNWMRDVKKHDAAAFLRECRKRLDIPVYAKSNGNFYIDYGESCVTSADPPVCQWLIGNEKNVARFVEKVTEVLDEWRQRQNKPMTAYRNIQPSCAHPVARVPSTSNADLSRVASSSYAKTPYARPVESDLRDSTYHHHHHHQQQQPMSSNFYPINHVPISYYPPATSSSVGHVEPLYTAVEKAACDKTINHQCFLEEGGKNWSSQVPGVEIMSNGYFPELTSLFDDYEYNPADFWIARSQSNENTEIKDPHHETAIADSIIHTRIHELLATEATQPNPQPENATANWG